MRFASGSTAGRLALAASLTASGMASAEVPEMFGCGVSVRRAVIAADGTVEQRIAPADMARIYIEHCDFVALGRFAAVTVADYDKVSPESVVALFVTDDVLIGQPLDAVRVEVHHSMLVQPGETVSRNTAWYVLQNEDFERLEVHDAIVAQLADLHRTQARLSSERLSSLERMVGELWRPPRRPIDRMAELATGNAGTFVSVGTTFFREGGAISPGTQFLLGLDVDEPKFRHNRRLTAFDKLIHWGDFAVAVADAIRAAR